METGDKGKGRRPVSDERRLKPRMVRMSDEQWQKVLANGGSKWLRALIDLAAGGRKPE